MFLLLALLFGASFAMYPYDTCNPGLVNEGFDCNEESLCWFGCQKGHCWSQCNGKLYYYADLTIPSVGLIPVQLHLRPRDTHVFPGAGSIAWDGPEGTCNTEYHMMWDIEWCWLAGEPEQTSCTNNADCKPIRGNECTGPCSIA